MHAHEQGGEADKGGCRGAGIGAPGARHVGEHVVVRALEGDAPLFVVADLFHHQFCMGRIPNVLFQLILPRGAAPWTPAVVIIPML